MTKGTSQNDLFDDQAPVIVVDNPILCNPFEEPDKYWYYNENGEPQQIPTRRPASYFFKTKRAYTGQTTLFAEEQREDLQLINLLRNDVRRWRKSGYEIATPITKKLLEYWSRSNRERRLFFCQLEGVETIIYINEILASNRKTRWNPELTEEDFQKLKQGVKPSFIDDTTVKDVLLPRLIDIPNETEYPNLHRYGCKMATGSGKTVVMAMLITWAFCNRGSQPSDVRFPDAALIICPNLTIRERLQVLRPDIADNYYRKFDLIPSSLIPFLQRGKVMIKNWHQLGEESENMESGESYRVVNKGIESADAFARRVLGELYDRSPVMVMNDEGHHAYRPKPIDTDSDLSEEEKKEREEATVWINGLDKINKACGIRFCVDMSATPFYIKGSGYVEGSPFPWIVSDFALVDAIESGIVKIPRIPVSDITGRPEPQYFNLWKYITADLRAGQKMQGGRPKPGVVWERANGALVQLAGQYKERFDYFKTGDERNLAIPPAMIIVCDNTNIAELFYQKISGEQTEEVEEKVTRGRKKGETKLVKIKSYGKGEPFPEIFSNTENALNSFRIDNKVMQETDSDEGQSKDEAKKKTRQIADTIGQHGKPGEQVKCIVSVQMLSEGWDANNVTHIFGLRAFGSQLLIEQVVGRGLRRMNYTIDKESNMFPPEYVDVYGIPFSIIPFKGRPTGKPEPDDKPVYHVRALTERENLKIEFPNVEGYVFDLKKNMISVDFQKLEKFDLEPLKDPIQTFIQPQVGIRMGGPAINPVLKVVTQDRKAYYENYHLQTIKFEIARQIVINLTYGRNDAHSGLKYQSRAQLFPQVLKIVDRYLDIKVNYMGCNPSEIGIEAYSSKVISLLTTAIEPSKLEGEPPLLPQLNRFKPIGSTLSVNFTTKKIPKLTIKSHINMMVGDTQTWEQSADFILEANYKVFSYVKNDHLEFTIPYEFEGVPLHYEPDFIVKLSNGVNLVLEIKGYEDNQTKAKHQGAHKWVNAVNNWGKLGHWVFIVCRNPAMLNYDIDKA
ncbi:MAG: DEAD/DEAH box helicase family protein [Bacteroidales bacterium]